MLKFKKFIGLNQITHAALDLKTKEDPYYQSVCIGDLKMPGTTIYRFRDGRKGSWAECMRDS